MLVTFRITKLNSIKKLYDLRSFNTVKYYSQTSDDMFKCYSEKGPFKGQYDALTEQDYGRFITKRAAKREPGLTRQIATVAYKMGKQMISLAEGVPNEDVFPFTKLSLETTMGDKIILEDTELKVALQYIPSQGHPALLEELRQFQQDLHQPPALSRDVIVTNGGQHGIYQCIELLLEPGDPIIMHEYAYTGIHSTLRPYQPEIIGIPEDDNGLIPETMEACLQDRLSRGLKMPKLLYVIPTGSNPTGTVLPEERRRRIYELACKYDFLILEDDPYMFLNYSEVPIPSFLSLDSCGRVVRLDSLSKVVSAGLRAGWVTAPAPLVQRLELHMQAEILHSCTIAQAILLSIVSRRQALASHLSSARSLYRKRRDALQEALQSVEGLAQWRVPDAGLFFWLRVNNVDDVYNMVFHSAFKRGLMLIPGQAFTYDTTVPSPYLRLAFSKIPLEDMSTAARHLGEIIRDEQARVLQHSQRLATER